MHRDHSYLYRRLVRGQAARLTRPQGGTEKKGLGLGPGHNHVIGVRLVQSGLRNLWEREE